jgi:dihydroorotate dehydrogenase (fumarate)
MDISTSYLGLHLKNPLVPSAGPLTRTADGMKRLEDAGAAAVVMHSIFEEQILHEAAELDHYLTSGTESFAEAQSYLPAADEYFLGPEEYVGEIEKAKKALSIPVIASLNGISGGGWVKYAKRFEEAGADAIELNVYHIPADARVTGAEMEQRYIDVLKAVKATVKIPVAIKLSPFFSSMANMAKRLDEAGANGLVLFNRFYQPDIDIESLEVVPNVQLSSSKSLRLPLRWVGILFGHINASMAATSGVHTSEDVVKLIMAGADVTMLCSSLLHHGPQHLTTVLNGLEHWMKEHEYVSVQQMRGSMSQKGIADPSVFERANYMKALNQYR